MNVDEFLDKCPVLCHVAAPGAWSSIREHGFRTAAQLIAAADLTDDERATLLNEPRRETVTLSVSGRAVQLRDQAPLLKRRDVGSLMGDDMTVADWIQVLNERVYLFADRTAMAKVLSKYVDVDGAQEVITLSPRRFIETFRSVVELSDQNTGAVARKAGPQKNRRTFRLLHDFPSNKRPSEVTVVGGFTDLSSVIYVDRHHRDGTKIRLER